MPETPPRRAAFVVEAGGVALAANNGLYGAGEVRCRAEPAATTIDSAYAGPAIGVVISGRFRYRSSGGSVTATPGTLLLGNAGEAFSYRFIEPGGVRRSVIALDSALVDEIADAAGLDGRGFPVPAVAPSRAGARLYAAIRRIAAGPPTPTEALAEVIEAALLQGRAATVRSASPQDRRRAADLARHIDDDFAEPLTLRRMAAHAGLSRFHLIRVFRAVTGESPHQYLIGARLRAAADRLMDTREPVTSVALGVGFNDISNFNTAFRRAFGMPPRAFRRAN